MVPRVLIAVVSCALPSFAADDAFVHVQTDRPSYRLGERIWYRVHGSGPAELRLDLLGASGGLVDSVAPADLAKSRQGSILIPDDIAGGTFTLRLEDEAAGRIRQIVPLEIYDLAIPKLDLDLVVLGTMHRAGDGLRAVFRARDMRGRPISGATVEYLLRFDGFRRRGDAGKTDDRGRAVVDLELPDGLCGRGSLAVGVANRGVEGAVSRPIRIASPIAAVDAFPEGGTIVAGMLLRFGLLVRGEDGEPCAASGRIVDDEGNSVAAFETDDHGLAIVSLRYEPERTYRAVIDSPSNTTKTFALPSLSDHRYALRVDEHDDELRVHVTAPKHNVEVAVIQSGRVVASHPVRFGTTTGVAAIPTGNLGGFADLVLTDKSRIFARRSVFLRARLPLRVELRAVDRTALVAGREVAFAVTAYSGDRPVDADLALSIYQGPPSDLPSIVTRSFLGVGALGDDASSREEMLRELPASFFAEDASALRDAFLIVHRASAFPAEGIAWMPGRGDGGTTALELTTRRPGPTRPEDSGDEVAVSDRGDRRKTVVRNGALERALDRASFTRSGLPEATVSHAVLLDVPAKKLLDAQRARGRAEILPQDLEIGRSLDTRRTLFWSGRVKTDARGAATVRVRLNHVVSELTWVAEGYAGDRPVSTRGRLQPQAGFATRFDAPSHLNIGDRFDIFLEAESTDESSAPVLVDFQAPDCFRPLLRTRMEFRPNKDSRWHRFRFEVVGEPDPIDTELRVLAQRGLHREEHVRRISVASSDLELSREESGYGKGLQALALALPPETVRDSVRVHASIVPRPARGSTSLADFSWRDLLRFFRWPNGCFEQFTSKNYANLIALDALNHGGHAAAMEPERLLTAHEMLDEGFRRLMSHRRESGAFTMFASGADDLRATIIAVRHLILYDKLFSGRGRPWLESALRWLRCQKGLSKSELLYLTMSLHEAGIRWMPLEKLLELDVDSHYDRALLVNCLLSWPDGAESAAVVEDAPAPTAVLASISSEPGASVPAAEDRDRLKDAIAANLDVLEGALPHASGELAGETGLMGSSGRGLSTEVLALAALALHEAGREETSRYFHHALLDRWGLCWGGSQATHLAVRTLSRLPPVLRSTALPDAEPFRVDFTTGSFGRHRRLVSSSDDTVLIESRLPPLGDLGVNLSLDIASDTERFFRLGCTYRVTKPVSCPDAPFRMSCSMTRSVTTGTRETIRVSIHPLRPTASTQTLVRVGIPGACVVDRPAMLSRAARGDIAHWEISGGFVDIYLCGEIGDVFRIDVPVVPMVEGEFRGRPSYVYPYYESGMASYSAPLSVRVRKVFGAIVDP